MNHPTSLEGINEILRDMVTCTLSVKGSPGRQSQNSYCWQRPEHNWKTKGKKHFPSLPPSLHIYLPSAQDGVRPALGSRHSREQERESPHPRATDLLVRDGLRCAETSMSQMCPRAPLSHETPQAMFGRCYALNALFC